MFGCFSSFPAAYTCTCILSASIGVIYYCPLSFFSLLPLSFFIICSTRKLFIPFCSIVSCSLSFSRLIRRAPFLPSFFLAFLLVYLFLLRTCSFFRSSYAIKLNHWYCPLSSAASTPHKHCHEQATVGIHTGRPTEGDFEEEACLPQGNDRALMMAGSVIRSADNGLRLTVKLTAPLVADFRRHCRRRRLRLSSVGGRGPCSADDLIKPQTTMKPDDTRLRLRCLHYTIHTDHLLYTLTSVCLSV